MTCSTTCSISSALSAGNGRFSPRNSSTTFPLTVTTKLPFAGFSGFTSTQALPPRASEIFKARVLNAFHCLHASITTSGSSVLFCGTGWILLLDPTPFFLVAVAASFLGAEDEALGAALAALALDAAFFLGAALRFWTMMTIRES